MTGGPIGRWCGNALAIGRLHVRRLAAGPAPARGEWGWTEYLPALDAELARMRADGTLALADFCDDAEFREAFLGGCGCNDCLVCHPGPCPCCGEESACPIVVGSCAGIVRTIPG